MSSLVRSAAQRRAVAGAQVIDRVAQDVEQLAVARRLTLAEDVVADDVDVIVTPGPISRTMPGDRRVEAGLVAVVGSSAPAA